MLVRLLLLSVICSSLSATTSLAQGYDELSGSSYGNQGYSAHPCHNEENPNDVDGDQDVTPMDVLLVIDFLNKHGSEPKSCDSHFMPDVNGDGSVTPLDAMLIIDEINAGYSE